MTADCGEAWQPATPAERLRAQLAALRDQHKTSDAYDQGITSQELATMNTVDVPARYL